MKFTLGDVYGFKKFYPREELDQGIWHVKLALGVTFEILWLTLQCVSSFRRLHHLAEEFDHGISFNCYMFSPNLP